MRNASSSPFASSSSSSEGSTLYAVRLPIEEPVSDLEEAVQKLKQCNSTELKQARRHHHRALEALHNGGYNALSEETRKQLLERLQTNLEALNEALDANERVQQVKRPPEETADRDSVPRRGSTPSSKTSSSFRLLDLLPWNW